MVLEDRTRGLGISDRDEACLGPRQAFAAALSGFLATPERGGQSSGVKNVCADQCGKPQ